MANQVTSITVGGVNDVNAPNNSLPVEKELVLKAKNGDRGAYRILVEKYQGKVYSLVFSLVRNREDAEDICQETFVKAYLSLKNFLGNSTFYTWLYRIAYNMAIDFKRSLKRKGGESVEVSELLGNDALSLTAESDSPEYTFARKERAAAIDKALKLLSEEHRSVVVLREVDGLSYDEISDVTGISKGTVMSRLHYARKKLQEALAEIHIGTLPQDTPVTSDDKNVNSAKSEMNKDTVSKNNKISANSSKENY